MIKLLNKILNTNTWADKYKSRRWIAMWLLTLITSLIFVFPPILTSLLGIKMVTLLSETGFIALLTFYWGSYLTSDYQTKKLGQYMPSKEDNSNAQEEASAEATDR